MVTIRDIAQAAGVSPMTVSNVLNKRPHVAEATREKVLETIDRLDYRVNVAARNLRRGRTHTIGLAVPEIDRPYFGQLAAAVIEEGARRDLNVVVEQTGRSRESELNALAASRVRMYDGLILSAVGLGSSDRDLLRVDFPVVILGERIFQGPVDHVAMANVEGSAAAVSHLIARGSRRIVAIHDHFEGDEVSVSSLRNAGYRRALAAHGIAYDPSLVVEIDEFTPERGAEAIARLLTQGMRFDGVFCVTDYVALGVLRGLADAGVDVPGDVKVIGFDDVEFSKYVVPSLSSVNPDHAFMAQTAVELLAARIESNDREAVEIVSPYTVVGRESTGGRVWSPLN
ncbi:LacI family transcriptional regulator [Leifsonia sp. Leaf336]|uniref:LacI family DNA-binding transcriptional regulator n=1 Tax=Leifsonia sp. Leaf336 TaxID=1736341 RepID=UPI0006FFA237|nr:LacI family DNA-binding transcriptional regulator [Leifsonia sp. Leaf336]KQR53626.1 LacI family transcriptional regulator [Leifsonia sp. Leaf336]